MKLKKRILSILIIFLLAFELLAYAWAFSFLDNKYDFANLLTRTQNAHNNVVTWQKWFNNFLIQYGIGVLSQILLMCFSIAAILGIVAICRHCINIGNLPIETLFAKGITCLALLPLVFYFLLNDRAYDIETLLMYFMFEMTVGFVTWIGGIVIRLIKK